MLPGPSDRVVQLCSDLIRIDTSPSGAGERAAAEFVAAELSDMGLDPQLLEPAPRRGGGTGGGEYVRGQSGNTSPSDSWQRCDPQLEPLQVCPTWWALAHRFAEWLRFDAPLELGRPK